MTNRDEARLRTCRRFEAMTVAVGGHLLGIALIPAQADEPLLALTRRAIGRPAREGGA